MNAYLYTWNPSLWNWSDQQDAIYRVNNGDQYDMYWSCGNTKKIEIGDVFFLIRLGVEPKGIIGCSYVTSEPYPLPHWDEEKANAGKEAMRTDLLFKALSEEPIVPLEYLQQRYPEYKWTPQAGGISLPQNIAEELFLLIQGSEKVSFPPMSKRDIDVYVEGKTNVVTYKTYDRSPAARQACIQHYGYSCTVCGFTFENAYGAIGSKYIEVHHLHQLADSGEEHIVNPIQDLRPVCANCHRMLHKTRPPISIEELRITIR
ncbi:MAG: HNH endonuclease [Candidatus Babeliaceae bacterium]|nr:HNH endonuclease [Candidatus Babeliaceae bacterium]